MKKHDTSAKLQLEIIKRYEPMLELASGTFLHSLKRVPLGWLPVLAMALREAEASKKGVTLTRVDVKRGALCASFLPGGDTATQEVVQGVLAECWAYCPCCGGLWPEDRP